MDIEKTIEFILDQQAQAAVNHAEARERLDRIEKAGERTDRRLDRAIRFAVREASAERARRREMEARFNEKMDKLAEAQRATQESLKALQDSLRRGGNGTGTHPRE